MAQGREVLCVLKADAYGHGARACGRALFSAGCRSFAVANLKEGVALRSVLPCGEILILGYTPPKEGEVLSQYRLSQTVFSADYAKALSYYLTHPISVHWKLDTGMHRLGFGEAQGREAILCCRTLPYLHTVGIFSHFANGGDPEESEGATQQFCQTVEALQEQGMEFSKIHLQNSAALCAGVGIVGNGVRSGLLLYGYGSSTVQPAASWESEIVSVCTVAAGEGVGYAPAWRAKKRSRIGILPIGYADGMLRSSVGGAVFGEGRWLPVVAVCMDMCMVELSDAPEIAVGTPIEVIGPHRSAEAWAQTRGTVSYEVLCHMGERQGRVYRTFGG